MYAAALPSIHVSQQNDPHHFKHFKQAASNSNSSASEEDNPRRSARSRSQTKFFTEDKMDVDSSSEAEETDDDMEEEPEPAQPIRKSSRSTAFRGEMKDPSNSIADLLKIADAVDDNKARSKRAKRRSSLEDTSGESDEERSVPPKRRSGGKTVKSPAKRHTKKRMSKAPEHHSESSSEGESDEESEEESEEEEEEEEMKFSKIIASKSLTLKEWKEVSSKINTTEITNGSRWIQESDPDENPEKYEERFLVKWTDLSHLHCSWETEKDLLEFCDGAKTKLSTFFRKSQGGLLYDADERLDGVSLECFGREDAVL